LNVERGSDYKGVFYRGPLEGDMSTKERVGALGASW